MAEAASPEPAPEAPSFRVDWPLAYANPARVEGAVAERRIFSPFCYQAVRLSQLCPIGWDEALRLAYWFPVIWREGRGGAPEFVALRTLRVDGRGLPSGADAALDSLPAALYAYPFLAADPPDRSGRVIPWIDATFAERVTDAGAPVQEPTGRLTRAAELRRALARRFLEAAPLTAAITARLSDDGLLEPWRFAIETGGKVFSVPGLSIIRQSAYGGRDLAGVLRAFGPPAAALMMAHRLSLYRMSWLSAAAGRAEAEIASASDAGAMNVAS